MTTLDRIFAELEVLKIKMAAYVADIDDYPSIHDDFVRIQELLAQLEEERK